MDSDVRCASELDLTLLPSSLHQPATLQVPPFETKQDSPYTRLLLDLVRTSCFAQATRRDPGIDVLQLYYLLR